MDQELHILIQISVYYEAPPLVLLLDANHNENDCSSEVETRVAGAFVTANVCVHYTFSKLT